MATSNILPSKPLNINDKSASSLWKSWRKTWNRFEVATGIGEAAEKKRVCTLLSVIGEDAVFETFQYAEGKRDDKLADVLKKFEEHCNPRHNTIYERYRFQCINQEAGETGSHYLTELRDAAECCDFANITTSQIIRDRFVHGMRDSKVRKRLLREKTLTLEKAYEMVQSAEAIAEQTHVMSDEQTVCAVKANSGRGQGHKGYVGPGQLRDYAKKQTQNRH